MASDRSILTISEAQEYLGGEDFTENNETIESFIDYVSGVIEDEYIHNKVVSQTCERYLYGSGTNCLELPFYPIQQLFGGTEAAQLASLKERTEYDGSLSNILTDLDQLYINPDHPYYLKIIDDSTTFTSETTFPNIWVKWYAGWPQATAPAPIKKVALEMLLIMWEESKKSGVGRLGRSSEANTQLGGSVTTTFEKMRPKWERDLARYRKLVDY